MSATPLEIMENLERSIHMYSYEERWNTLKQLLEQNAGNTTRIEELEKSLYKIYTYCIETNRFERFESEIASVLKLGRFADISEVGSIEPIGPA